MDLVKSEKLGQSQRKGSNVCCKNEKKNPYQSFSECPLFQHYGSSLYPGLSQNLLGCRRLL